MPVDINDPAIAEDLRKLDAILEANPLEGYNSPNVNAIIKAVGGKAKPLHKKQLALHRVQGNGLKRVYLGGNRGGKTTGGVIDDLIQALPEDLVPPHLRKYKFWQPPFTCRIVTPDFTRTMAAVYEVIRRWCPRAGMRGGSWEKAFDKQNRVLYLTHGSFFEFMTYEQDLDKFGGTARHRIHYDEEPPGEKGEAVRTECRFRLADYNGDELFSFTPLLGLTWTFDEFWEKKGPETEKDVWEKDGLLVIRADMDDNPHISEAGKQAALEGLPDAVREARKSGNFAHFKGLVYPEFDFERHTRDQVEPSHLKGQTVYVAIDPGMETTAVIFGAFDKDNSLLVFDELYATGQGAIPEKVSERIKERLAYWGVEPRYFLIDPSARNRALTDAQRVQQLYWNAGIKVHPAQNDVEAGIFEVKRRLEDDFLLIARNCKRLLWERDRYRMDSRDDGKFAVVKRNDHGCDCLRYLCAARPRAPKARNSRANKRQAWKPGTAPSLRDYPQKRELAPLGPFS